MFIDEIMTKQTHILKISIPFLSLSLAPWTHPFLSERGPTISLEKRSVLEVRKPLWVCTDSSDDTNGGGKDGYIFVFNFKDFSEGKIVSSVRVGCYCGHNRRKRGS